MTASPPLVDALRTAVEKLPGDALAEVRRNALAALDQAGLPTTREEDWKYTDFSSLATITNNWIAAGARHAEAVRRLPLPDVDAHWIEIRNGRIDDASLAALPDGVSVERYADTAQGLVSSGRLGHLNLALLEDGLRISIAERVRLARPIGLFVADETGAETVVTQVRVDIEMAAGSHARIVEWLASQGSGDLYCNSVIRLQLVDGADADYVRIQQRDFSHNHTGHLEVHLGHGTRLRHASFDLGGRLVRNDMAIDIQSDGAVAETAGLYLVGGGQHIDNHVRVDHHVGPATSRQHYRGIVTGKSRAVWNGKAIVHEGADGTDAEQANHNLLLSEQAEIDAKPELEIYADDVKCSHGTTVGQLDENALYYLRTRGLDESEAHQVLTRAFAQTIVQKTPIDSLHDYLEQQVAERLRSMQNGAKQ